MHHARRHRALKGLVGGAGLVALAACTPELTATAPGGALGGARPLAFVSVEGPEAAQMKKFESLLHAEARRQGFDVVGDGQGGANPLRVKTYLDAFSAADGKAGFSWVLEASDDGRTRAARVTGSATSGTAASSPWAALDDAAMRQIASAGVGDLVKQLQASSAVPLDAAQ